jgi:prepilin-type N-terminal cleavage/methylation domain-containing protein
MQRHLGRARERQDKGFTLIEVLVVVIIIGILAAIAIPIFLHQREKAVDASAKSDARVIATQLESFHTDTEVYPSAADYSFTTPRVTIGDETVTMSPGNVPSVYVNIGGTAYCISVDNPGRSTRPWVWQGDRGGLQTDRAADCSAYPNALS